MAERAAKGRWKAGASGNPAGRKPGTGAVGKLRAVIAKRVPAIIAKLVDQALGGDVQAAKLLLERTLPALKAAEQAEPVNMHGETLSAQGAAVLAAVAAGELAPGQGAALLAGLGALARVREIDELDARLTALEKGT